MSSWNSPLPARDHNWKIPASSGPIFGKHVNLTYAEFTGTKEADVEDVFETSFYVSLVNAEFSNQLSAPIKVSALNTKLPRVLQRIDEYLVANPLTSGKFGHFRPARYMSENIGEVASKLAPATLDRFEEVFKKLNSLLP